MTVVITTAKGTRCLFVRVSKVVKGAPHPITHTPRSFVDRLVFDDGSFKDYLATDSVEIVNPFDDDIFTEGYTPLLRKYKCDM